MNQMLEYAIGTTRHNGRYLRYLRIKSDDEINDLSPVVSFTKEQPDKISVYECIIGPMIRELHNADGFYKWYELQSVLIETDHTPPVVSSVKEIAPNAAVASLTFVALSESGQFDNVTIAEHAEQFAEWESNIAYSASAIRSYESILYRCIQAHTSQIGWEPSVAVSLWSKISDPNEEWPEWSAPIGSHDAYGKGDKVSHNGEKWVSTVDSNVWEPSVYGWDQHIESIE